MQVLETFFHQFYTEGNGFRWKNLFELHFLILNIFLSFSASAAADFFSKIMFKKKLDFFSPHFRPQISGDIYISTNFFRPTFDHDSF